MDPDKTFADTNGWGNLAAGLKYAWLLEPEQGLASNIQLIFEAPTGNSDVFQGEGDGVFIPSASIMKLWNRWQFIDQLGFKLPVDSDAESSSMFNSFHASYALLDWFFPTFEVNWWHVLDAGSGEPNFNSQAGGAVPPSLNSRAATSSISAPSTPRKTATSSPSASASAPASRTSTTSTSASVTNSRSPTTATASTTTASSSTP